MADFGAELLKRQLNELAKNPIDLVSVGLTDESNVYDWEILIMGPDGTLYEGCFFKARLVFPQNFPYRPPTMTFQSEMWHPNICKNGEVCISILHDPGEDPHNLLELAEERWRPILGVEQILMSVISMLSDPNDEISANLDAAIQWRDDRAGFNKKVRQCVRMSQEEDWASVQRVVIQSMGDIASGIPVAVGVGITEPMTDVKAQTRQEPQRVNEHAGNIACKLLFFFILIGFGLWKLIGAILSMTSAVGGI
ncbi:hypothetical protein ACHAW5_010064 [Stephanodiscus triporus]|uniref:UBC core domain-containing protein n=1 Tax=Stephanodiscus triporus TaxID=2934178 RepID=A0ABD3QNG0_9STRA